MPTETRRTCTSVRSFIRTPRPLLTPLMLAALGLAGAARADDGLGAAELIQRIEKLEASNRALTTEIAELRQSDGEAWLTELDDTELAALVRLGEERS